MHEVKMEPLTGLTMVDDDTAQVQVVVLCLLCVREVIPSLKVIDVRLVFTDDDSVMLELDDGNNTDENVSVGEESSVLDVLIRIVEVLELHE